MITCMQHRSTVCACLKKRETPYKPKTDHLLSRANAMEVWVACGAFPENIAYSPQAMRELAHSYLTVAEQLAQETNKYAVRIMLKDAGFVAD